MKTISLCMIVRNEEPVLGRCLEGAALFADEIIVVDTGSTDATKDIAARYTKKVYDFPWRDDFAAARNYSFGFATGEYIMWLDADDVIDEENAGKLIGLKGTMPDRPAYITMLYDIPQNGGCCYYLRMVRRDAHPVWQGALHEWISPGGQGMRTDILIMHRRLCPRDSERNIRIIRKMLRENLPMDFRMNANCWLDCHQAGEPALADLLFRSCLQQADSGNSFCIENALFIASVLENLEDFQYAAAWYKLALSLSGSNDQDAFAACQRLVKCCFRLEQWEEAWHYNEKASELRPASRSTALNRMALLLCGGTGGPAAKERKATDEDHQPLYDRPR